MTFDLAGVPYTEHELSLIRERAGHELGLLADIERRWLATLDAALADAGYVIVKAEDGLDVERLARALDACLPEHVVTSKPGNRVRAKAIAREYAALRDALEPKP